MRMSGEQASRPLSQDTVRVIRSWYQFKLTLREDSRMKDLLLCLKPNQRKGSKPRCHWLTHGTRKQVAKRLTKLTSPWGIVSENDYWMPEGFCDIEEAQLHKATKLLPQEHCDKLDKWWLAEPCEESQTPNFDIASTCTIKGTKGMLLVEAKAHSTELKV